MFRSLGMMKGARKLVCQCGKVQPNEEVVIVTDTDRTNIAEVIALATVEQGANPTIIILMPREYDGADVPGPVGRAMESADVVFTTVTKSITHSRAVKNALSQGARILSMVQFEEATLSAGGIDMDFETHRERCELVARAFTTASKARITTPAGTDLTMSLENRNGNAHSGIVENPGEFSAAIHVEANIAPVEESVEGIIVVDGSIPNLQTGVLNEPVILRVVKGDIVEVTGGTVANQLRKYWYDLGDKGVYGVGQLAIGLNPECPTLTGNHVNDHGAFGHVHFGVGTSENIGGSHRAKSHIDVMITDPTVVLDDRLLVVENGNLVLR